MWPTGRAVTRLFGPRLLSEGGGRRGGRVQERIGGAVIAGERMTRLQGETTDGWMESDADRGERGTCQDHLIVLVFKWLRCPDCRGAEGAAPRETMNSLKGWSERERGGELQKCRSCRRDATSAAAFASAVAVIVVWRGKERVDTKQLSLGAEERWERAGRINEPGSYKMQAYRIVCQNGAAPAAFAPSDGRRGRGCISSASSRVRR